MNESLLQSKDVVCGVYEIRNTVNNKVYIGSSINIYKVLGTNTVKKNLCLKL